MRIPKSHGSVRTVQPRDLLPGMELVMNETDSAWLTQRVDRVENYACTKRDTHVLLKSGEQDTKGRPMCIPYCAPQQVADHG